MAIRKRAAKRRAPAKRKKAAPRKKARKKARKKTRKKKARKKVASRRGRDRFSELTTAHAKAVASGDTTVAKLVKRELTKGRRRRK